MIRPLPGPEIYEGIEKLNLPADAQGWHSNHPIFSQLIDELEPEVIIECGTWKGASAIHMARLTDNHPEIMVQNCKIFCVDTWLGGIDHELNQQEPTSILPREHGYPRLYFQFLSNVKRAGVHERVIPIPQSSINGARFLGAHKIQADLCYVDGTHEFPEALWDMSFYWPLVRPGGILFGDDVSWESVEKCLGAFSAMVDVKPVIVDGNFWICRKPSS